MRLYYNNDIVKESKKLIAIPMEEVLLELNLGDEKKNLFHKIILELFRANCGTKTDAKDVLKFDDELINYIFDELRKTNYIEGSEITERGLEFLKDFDNPKDKLNGSVFYNILSESYEPYINFEGELLEDANELKYQDEEDIYIGNNSFKKTIEFGRFGSVQHKEVFFNNFNNFKLENEDSKHLNIDLFIDLVKTNSIRIRYRDEDGELTLSGDEKKSFFKRKLENLNDIISFKEKRRDREKVFLIVGIGEDEKIRNPLFSKRNDESLKIDLLGIDELKEYFNDEIVAKYSLSKKNKEKLKNKEKEDYEKILKESSNKISEDLIDKIKNYSDDKQYSEIIDIIYQSFITIFKEIVGNKIQNVTQLRLHSILNKITDDEKILDFYRIDYKYPSKLRESPKLKESFIYALIADDSSERKLVKFVNEDFLVFIKDFTYIRNQTSHHDPFDETSELPTVALELLFNLILEIKGVDLKLILSERKISKEEQKEIEESTDERSREIVSNEFPNDDATIIEKELMVIYKNFLYYKEYNSNYHKALFMKSVGILLEKNLKELRKRFLDSKIKLDLGEKDPIYLTDIEDKFFPQKESEKSYIDKMFDEIKSNIPISKKKIEKTARTFKKGTLNTYTAVLLYSGKVEYSEIFKLAFIVSAYRGHNGYFKLLKENNDLEKEKKEVEKFLKTVFEVEKNFLKELKR